MYKLYYSSELYHYGTLGQKWGVRRYQNYDGSLTQAGLERYRKAGEDYDTKKAKYKTIKSDPNSSSYDRKMAKSKMKAAKREMNTRYKNLKRLKQADKGKIRYLSGERIREKAAITSALEKIGSLSLSGAAYIYANNKSGQQILKGKISDADAVNALSLIGGLSLTAAGIKRVADEIPNRQLRAYYDHPTVRK